MPELDISVMEGQALIQHWSCTCTTMPDGAPGVLWRGVAYRLLPGNKIDVSLPAEATAGFNYAVLPGEEASWVLVAGLPTALQEARAALERGGMTVSRSGRWLGDSLGERAFDWFLRCDGQLDEATVARLLGHSTPADGDSSAAQIAVLHQRIADLLAECARTQVALRNVVERPPLPPAQVESAPDHSLEVAMAQIARLQEALNSAQMAPKPPALPARSTRTYDEVKGVLAALRPDVVLLRDSLQVAFGEFPSRAGFYGVLNDLPTSGARPDGWKKLRGAEHWWECHVSTGQNDHGRAYARFDGLKRQWSVLLSIKKAQGHDILWLQAQ